MNVIKVSFTVTKCMCIAHSSSCPCYTENEEQQIVEASNEHGIKGKYRRVE